MRRMLCACLVVLFGLAVQPVRAEESFIEINVSGGFQTINVQDTAFDFFEEEDWFTPANLYGEVEVWNELFVQLGVGSVTLSSRLYDRWPTSMEVVEPYLGVRKGFTVVDGIRPYAALTAIYTISRAEIEIEGGHVVGQDRGWAEGTFGGRLGLGVELFVPRRVFAVDRGLFKDFTLGVALEGGYTLRQPIGLDEVSQGDSGDLDDSPPMPGGVLDLGDLDLSGPYFAMDFKLYF